METQPRTGIGTWTNTREGRRRLPPQPLVDTLYEHKPTRILDVGGLAGYFAVPILERLPSAELIYLNMSDEKLSGLNARAADAGASGRIRVLERGGEAGPEHIPLDDEAVDAVLMTARFHALKNRPAYLKELHRVLRDGGRIVICDWEPGSTFEGAPPRNRRLRADHAIEQLADAGFESVEARGLYEDFWVLVGAKV